MVSNKEEKDSIKKSIKSLENQLISTNREVYRIQRERKFLNHQIADLKYELRQKDNDQK